MNQQQIDREIDILFLETPSTIFHFLCGTYEEKHLRILDLKFLNIISRVDALEGTAERKPRIARIQLVQAIIDKVIDCCTKSASINEIKSNFEIQLNDTKIETDKKTSEIMSELEKTKNTLDQMTLQYNIVDQLFKKTHTELQQKIIDHEILAQSHSISSNQPNIETKQNLYTDAKIESLVCDNESLRNNNTNLSKNISNLQQNISEKNREIGLLTTALSIEKAKNIKLNEAIKSRNDKIAEREKNPFADLMATISTPYNTNKK